MVVPADLSAQENDDHKGHDHHHRHNEISLGGGPSFLPAENEWGYGIHGHAILGVTEWMGAGIGYEIIRGDHTHHTISALAHFHPVHPLDINLGPGVVLPDEEHEDLRFKFHVEVAAVFELNEHLHLGPSIDAGIGAHDLHLTMGIHVGWIFSFHRDH